MTQLGKKKHYCPVGKRVSLKEEGLGIEMGSFEMQREGVEEPAWG